MKLINYYQFNCYRNGKLRWQESVKNLVVNEGLDDLLDKYLKGSAYTATWYTSIIDNAGFTTIAAGDTAAKITETANPPTTNGWQEATEYDEANRPTITLGTVSGQSVDNVASKATFTFNDTLTLKGAFVISNNTKAGTTGTLLGAVAFASTRDVVPTDTLDLTVTFTSASD